MKILIFLVVALTSNIVSAFDYESYTKKSFEEAIEEHKEDFGSGVDIGISAIPFKYKTNVIFTKKTRKIPIARLEFIKIWAKGLRQPESFINQYKHEFLIIENGREIWLPMQEQVIPFMNEELIEGRKFEIYFFLAGLENEQVFFLGTEFRLK